MKDVKDAPISEVYVERCRGEPISAARVRLVPQKSPYAADALVGSFVSDTKIWLLR